MKKLLIINRKQFGYHIDSYKYCQYLKNDFEITYIGFDTGKDKIKENGVNIVYVPYENSVIKNGFKFIQACRKQIKSERYDIVFLVYFLMASFVKIGCNKQHYILDIRTGSINKNSKKRFIEDNILKVEALFFKNITIISECLRAKLNLNNKKCHILPLGSDPIVLNDKSFNNMNLLYVGTLNGRDIHDTVSGLSKFINSFNEYALQCEITYDIIGFGNREVELLLLNTISKLQLEDIVTFHGQKTHAELSPYFKKANIGISYIPLKEYYQCQPPTKTFEYINSGLFCIGTETKEHKHLISEKNGILCTDNAQSFSYALKQVYKNRDKYNSEQIRESLHEYSWNNIISNNLRMYLYLQLSKNEMTK